MDHRATSDRDGRDGLSQVLAWMLIAAIFIGGLPIITGVVVIADSKPALTLDVCHPIGSASYNLDPSEAPLIPMLAAARPPADQGSAHEAAAVFPSRPSLAPDPPPPKIA